MRFHIRMTCFTVSSQKVSGLLEWCSAVRAADTTVRLRRLAKEFSCGWCVVICNDYLNSTYVRGTALTLFDIFSTVDGWRTAMFGSDERYGDGAYALDSRAARDEE